MSTLAILAFSNAGSALGIARVVKVKSLDENTSLTKNDPLNSAVVNPSTYRMSFAFRLCLVVAVAYIKSVLVLAVLII